MARGHPAGASCSHPLRRAPTPAAFLVFAGISNRDELESDSYQRVASSRSRIRPIDTDGSTGAGLSMRA